MISSLKDKIQAILERDLIGLPRWKRFFIRSFQVLSATIRDLTSEPQFSLLAMSLVYTTLITMVPLLAISFSVLKGFGVHGQVEPLLLNLLEGLGPEKSQEVSAQVMEFVDNIKIGVLGAIGVGLLIYAVIALMQKIEGAFNYIWRVGRDRTIARRFSDYLSVLLMGPFLIFISAGITTTIRHSDAYQQVSGQLAQYELFSSLFEAGSFILPWLIMALGFTFIYTYMPNTKVRIGNAFIGGMVAALLWKLMGSIFVAFIAGSANYAAIYAAFATLIVMMIWLYAIWLVVLIGANVSFYMQYPRYLRISREPLVLSPHLQLILGLNILERITDAYYESKPAWNIDRLSKELNVPVLAIQRVIELLERGRIIASTNDDDTIYVPACPFDQTPFEKVLDALEKQHSKGWLQTERMHLSEKSFGLVKTIEEARKKALTEQTIRAVFRGN